MPLFPPVTDTLRWADLVRQGRAQLPLVAPEWTDQNTSDPGIAVLELLAWLVEADSFRAAAVTDRERRLLLALAGVTAAPARPATCLVRVTAAGPRRVPAGLAADGLRQGTAIPLSLVDDVAVTGATVVAVAAAGPDAEHNDYRTGCVDLTLRRAAGLPVAPLGPDPAPRCALLVGLRGPSGAGLRAGPVDLWAEAAPGPSAPEVAGPPGPHHSARLRWETWDGTAWTPLPGAAVDDGTAALSRSGRVRLTLPAAVPAVPLGDQASGALAGVRCAWLRARQAAGRHDAAPLLAALHVDVGVAAATLPYATTLVVPPGTPVSGAPTAGIPLPSAVVRPVVAADGTLAALHLGPPPPAGGTGPPAVAVLAWQPPTGTAAGRLHADFAVLGTATGVPDETFRLPEPWCAGPPAVWAVAPDGAAAAVPVVTDLAQAGAADLVAALDPDGVTVSFGDGRTGATLAAGATVLAAGRWTVPAGVSRLAPPLPVEIPVDDRNRALLGAAAGTVGLAAVAGHADGSRPDDTGALAARAESALWVHERVADAAVGGSLDGLDPSAVRALGVPERAVTGPDLERVALATPGTVLHRARALVEVDPRLPGLRATGCVTVVVVPALPLARPEPTPELLARVRAALAATRTLGTRVFVVGPRYAVVDVTADLLLAAGAPAATRDAAEAALRAFLHPVTGGPVGRGWPFGRAVRRTEVLQALGGVPGVEGVAGLTLARRAGADGCGDVPLCPTELALAGTLTLRVRPGDRP